MHVEWEGHVLSLPDSFDVHVYSVTGDVCYCLLFLSIPMILSKHTAGSLISNHHCKKNDRAVSTIGNSMMINCSNLRNIDILICPVPSLLQQ